MIVTVLKENLVRALSIINRNISSKPQLPVLSHVLLKTEKGKLKLSATNLETGINLYTGAKVEEEGEATIPARVFLEYVTSLSAEKVEIETKQNKTTIRSPGSRAEMIGLETKEFPPFPEINEKGKRVFTLNTLFEAITRTAFAAATNEGRPVLTGIKIGLMPGKIKLAATDGYRLSIEEIIMPEEKEEAEIIIPAKSLTEVVRIATEIKEKEIGLVLLKDKKQAIFLLTDVVFYTRLIDGEFPKVEKIIPSSYKTKVTIDKEKTIQAIKLSSIFARSGANIIKIKIEKDKLRIMSNTPELGTGENEVEARIEGEEGEVAFNYRFLLDLLPNFPGEEVVFETNGALNPGVFKPTTGLPNFLHIIMPVRVQEQS